MILNSREIEKYIDEHALIYLNKGKTIKELKELNDFLFQYDQKIKLEYRKYQKLIHYHKDEYRINYDENDTILLDEIEVADHMEDVLYIQCEHFAIALLDKML